MKKSNDLYKLWHGKEGKTLIDLNIPGVNLNEPLIVLGKMPEIMYRSAKHEITNFNYVHEFTKMPYLCSDSAGKVLLILGGNFRITERGIVG